MSNTDTEMDFAGTLRRQRDQPPEPQPEPQPEPVAMRSLSAVGQTFIQQVEKLQSERDRLANELNAANARIEQFEIAQNDLRSQLETARLELKQQTEITGAERAERIRLGVAIEQTIGTLRGHLTQPDQPERT